VRTYKSCRQGGGNLSVRRGEKSLVGHHRTKPPFPENHSTERNFRTRATTSAGTAAKILEGNRTEIGPVFVGKGEAPPGTYQV